MKSLFLTLTILIISSASFASDIDVSGRWTGSQGNSTISFEFLAEGNKLEGLYLGSGAGDERTVIVKGKVKTSKKGTEISFEVPFNTGGVKMSRVYKGEVLDENTIEFTLKTKTRGSRQAGFSGFNDGFSGGGGGGAGGGFSSGFDGGGSRETKLIIKRVAKF